VVACGLYNPLLNSTLISRIGTRAFQPRGSSCKVFTTRLLPRFPISAASEGPSKIYSIAPAIAAGSRGGTQIPHPFASTTSRNRGKSAAMTIRQAASRGRSTTDRRLAVSTVGAGTKVAHREIDNCIVHLFRCYTMADPKALTNHTPVVAFPPTKTTAQTHCTQPSNRSVTGGHRPAFPVCRLAGRFSDHTIPSSPNPFGRWG
jgi:hypothetical protein